MSAISFLLSRRYPRNLPLGLPPNLPFRRELAAFLGLRILPKATAAGFLGLSVMAWPYQIRFILCSHESLTRLAKLRAFHTIARAIRFNPIAQSEK